MFGVLIPTTVYDGVIYAKNGPALISSSFFFLVIQDAFTWY